MKKRFFVTCCCLLFIAAVFAQNRGQNWVLGYSSPTVDTFLEATMKLDFSTAPFTVDKYATSPSPIFLMKFTNASISSESGELQLFTNGVTIYNKDFQAVENGALLPEDPTWHTYLPSSQGGVFLPFPGSKDSIFFLTGDPFHFDWAPANSNRGGQKNLTYSVIDMSENGGNGKMVERKTPLIQDTLPRGLITAVKHANGRDWWSLAFRYNQNRYYPVLFTPEGPKVQGLKSLPGFTKNSTGQAAFSPDGAWYARYNTVGSPFAGYIDIYRFDRCAGALSAPLNKRVSVDASWGGIAFSPDSRFVYASAFDSIFQFDLQAADILESQRLVAVYDSFVHDIFPHNAVDVFVPTRFFHMQTAPDGKIYICSPGNNSFYLHTIEKPNLQGVACEVRQHSVRLPAPTDTAIPNLPNYNLGPLEGSPCDTLIFTSTKLPMQTGPDISIYPNPTRDVFQYSASAQVSTLQIFNELGQLVLKKQIDQQEGVVRVAHLPEGIYVYSFWNADGEMVGRGRLVKVD